MYTKHVIFPNVVIYKNLLENVDKVLETIKISEEYKEKKYIFSPWNEWFGNWEGISTQIDGGRYSVIDGNDYEAESQKEFLRNVYNAYDLSLKDFLSEFPPNETWAPFIKNLDTSNKSVWTEAGISILKYERPKPDQSITDLAMNYHTDTNPSDLESPGQKLAVTVTMYLNDDYEGGEISFYDDDKKKIYNYKPKAGDITVFPSFSPYYHGVLPFIGDSRYLLRMFLTYESAGSDEWFKNQALYGKETWDEMEKERIKKSWQRSDHVISISYPGSLHNINPNVKTVHLKEDPVWINLD